MAMQPTGTPTRKNRLVLGLVRFMVTLVVLGLMGLVGYLAAERNARTFTLEVQDDQLVVQKGRNLPVGADPWRPDDPSLAESYAPIPLYGNMPSQGFLEQSFHERDELDRALFDFIERLARPRVASDDPSEQERGVYYLRRAELLQGINRTQRETLQALKSQVAWYQAKLKLESAQQLVSDALVQLDLAMRARDANSQRARELASRLMGPAREMETALRRALADTGTAPAPGRFEGERQNGQPMAPARPDVEAPQTQQEPLDPQQQDAEGSDIAPQPSPDSP